MKIPEFFSDDVFLKNARTQYDLVLIESESSPTTSFVAQVLHALREEKSILAICTTSPATLLFPLGSLAQKKFTVVESFAGVLALGAKGSWQHTDLLSAHGYGFTLLETHILEGFSRFFALHDKLLYIRTTPELHSEQDFPQATYLDTQDLVQSFQSHGFSGSSYTLLGSTLASIELFSAHHFLQEQHHSGDLFLSKTPFLIFPKGLQESIQRTGHLIVVLDTLPTPLVTSRFYAQLLQNKLIDAKLTLITPDYARITSIAPEYLFEQARFDGTGIAEKIKGSID